MLKPKSVISAEQSKDRFGFKYLISLSIQAEDKTMKTKRSEQGMSLSGRRKECVGRGGITPRG